MNKCMILCNTYFQLIIAIQMKLTIKKDEYVILVLSDHSRNAKDTAKRLRTASIFEQVIFLESSSVDHQLHSGRCGLWKEPQYIWNSICGKSIFITIPETCQIDEFVYYNLSMSVINIFSMLYEKNPGMCCSSLEEGIFSYGLIPQKCAGIRAKLTFGAREKLGKQNILDCTSSVYCFYPELYQGSLTPIPIPLFNQNEQLLSILNKIFPISTQTDQYNRKYIMLTSVYDFEGGAPVGEFELTQKIAEIVGKENLLIKLHPRDFRTVYEDAGFTVDRNSDYPWEVIQLSMDFSDKVLLTANSGGVLSISMVMKQKPIVFFLYPFCNMEANPQMAKIVRNIQTILSDPKTQNQLTGVSVPDYLDEIKRGF